MAAERVSFARVLSDVGEAAGVLVALAVLLAVPSCCLVTLPAFGFVAGHVYLRVSGARRASISTWRLGILGAPIYFAPLAAFFLSAGILDAFPGPEARSDALGLQVTLLVSSLLGLVLFPLYAAPLEAIETGAGMLESMLGAGARAARSGLAVTLGRGAMVGLLTALPWFVPALVRQILPGHALWELAALYLCVVATQLVALAFVAHAWSEERERFGAARTLVTTPPRGVPARARLVSSLALAAGPAALLSIMLLLALLTPTAAWRRVDPPPGLASPPGLPLAAEPLRDSAEGLTITQDSDDGWILSTRDGGGSGHVRVHGGDPSRATLAREAFRDREVWTLHVPTSTGVALVSFDDRGVRVDDTPIDRLEARLAGARGVSVAILYALSLALLLAFQLRRVGVATGLDRPRFSGVRERAALTGTLRTTVPITVSREGLVLTESARLELGEAGTITLAAATLPLLVPSAKSVVRDGAMLTIIATLPASDRSPFRESGAPLPEGALAVLGSLDDAREQYANRVARANVLAALPLLLLALGLTATIAMRL